MLFKISSAVIWLYSENGDEKNFSYLGPRQ